uniref:Uncharacterized protein n=1 Tax=Setaria italica TaxID=4555 RepID=K3YFK4_SETIT
MHQQKTLTCHISVLFPPPHLSISGIKSMELQTDAYKRAKLLTPSSMTPDVRYIVR